MIVHSCLAQAQAQGHEDARRCLAPWAGVMMAVLLLFGAAPAARAIDQEAAVASVMGRFLQFVTWPDNAFATRQAPLVVGILGRPEQSEAVHRVVMGRTNSGHAIEVRLLHSAKDARGCHLLYISPNERDQMAGVTAAIAGTSTITVSDMPGFLGEGGNVALVVEDNHPAFDINLTAAEQSGVRISSRLLQVARAVLRAGM